MPDMPTSKEVMEALEGLKALMSKTPFTYYSVGLTETAVQDIPVETRRRHSKKSNVKDFVQSG